PTSCLSAILAARTAAILFCGAGNGTRTRDPELGRLALYQLSYSRSLYADPYGGEGRIRTSEGVRRQIYSLIPLAAREPLPRYCSNHSRWSESNRRPTDYKSVALPTELHRQRLKMEPYRQGVTLSRRSPSKAPGGGEVCLVFHYAACS